MATTPKPREGLKVLLRALKLPAFAAYCEETAVKAEAEGWTFLDYLHYLAETEVGERKRRRVERLLKGSGLPPEKTLATLDLSRFPTKARRQIATLCEGSFVDQAENVLAFGLPGRGKTHALCAIADELIRRGFKILFTPAFRLVQRLLAAKRALTLERELRQLDSFDAVLIDDIGYIQQDREEMEVLFTFFAERYERRSVMITSNLVFSQWDRIFKDPMTTAAAIDRLIHHSTIVELTGPSIRNNDALERQTATHDTTSNEPSAGPAPTSPEVE